MRPKADNSLAETGQQLALSVNDALNYTLPDPTGTSLTLIDNRGNRASYILYDS